MSHRYVSVRMQLWFAGFVSVILLSLSDKPDIKSVQVSNCLKVNLLHSDIEVHTFLGKEVQLKAAISNVGITILYQKKTFQHHQ
jgi:hypothetical protein